MPQIITDLTTLIGWIWENATIIIGSVFSPVKYIYTFLRNFFVSAFSTPPEPEGLWSFPSDILALFNSVPYLTTLVAAAMIALTLIIAVSLIKTFLKT